jgi:hypothetical protein
MDANLIFYTDPQRPIINPKFDLFVWLSSPQEPDLLFPAKVVDKVQVMLPDKVRTSELNEDNWLFLVWQAEQKGYTVVRSIDDNWWYWAILADKYTLLEMVHLLK